MDNIGPRLELATNGPGLPPMLDHERSSQGWTMSAERDRGGPTRTRSSPLRTLVALAVVFMVASLLILFVSGAGGRGFAADRLRRAQEIETQVAHLYRQLAAKDAVLESQRRIYMERFRRLEAHIRQKEQEIATLRARLATITSSPGGARAVGVAKGPIGGRDDID